MIEDAKWHSNKATEENDIMLIVEAELGGEWCPAADPYSTNDGWFTTTDNELHLVELKTRHYTEEQILGYGGMIMEYNKLMLLFEKTSEVLSNTKLIPHYTLMYVVKYMNRIVVYHIPYCDLMLKPWITKRYKKTTAFNDNQKCDKKIMLLDESYVYKRINLI